GFLRLELSFTASPGGEVGAAVAAALGFGGGGGAGTTGRGAAAGTTAAGGESFPAPGELDLSESSRRRSRSSVTRRSSGAWPGAATRGRRARVLLAMEPRRGFPVSAMSSR